MLVPENFPDRSVCVLGLGYVGLTLAATMASVGFRVWGIEIRPQVVADLRKGRPHFHEPGLQDHLSRTVESGALTVHESIPADCDATVYIITVGTPLGPNGRARLDMIEHTAREVAGAMPPNALVVLRSTVRLGTTRNVVAPILEATGRAYDLAFCPERTLEGSALKELRTLPQIVGGATLQATVRASQLFQFITVTTIRVANLETAETIKLVDNTQRDVHFAFSNEVARICDAIGVSAAEVINAGKLGYPAHQPAAAGPGRRTMPGEGPVHHGGGRRGARRHAGDHARGAPSQRSAAAQSMAALKRIVDQIDGFPTNPVDRAARPRLQGPARDRRPARHHGAADPRGAQGALPRRDLPRLRRRGRARRRSATSVSPRRRRLPRPSPAPTSRSSPTTIPCSAACRWRRCRRRWRSPR